MRGTGVTCELLVFFWAVVLVLMNSSCVRGPQRYMQEMIDERRASDVKSDRCDLFRNLLDANSGAFARSDSRLPDDELIGNYQIISG